MKVALLLYGVPRFIDDSAPSDFYKENIIDKYDTDVYAHCWFEKINTLEQSPWRKNKAHLKKTTSKQTEDNPCPRNAVELIKKYYNPTDMKVDVPEFFSFKKEAEDVLHSRFTGKEAWGYTYSSVGYSNILSQYKSIEEVTNLVLKNSTEYNIFVLARFDAIVYPLPELHSLDNRKMHIRAPGGGNTFPDGIHLFGPRMLTWFNRLHEEVQTKTICENVLRPSSEMFKKLYFETHFSNKSDLVHHQMQLKILRK